MRASTSIVLYALFFWASLFVSEAFYTGTATAFLPVSSPNCTDTPFERVSIPDFLMEPAKRASAYHCPTPKPLLAYSYKELAVAFYLKSSEDARKSLSEASMTFVEHYRYGRDALIKLTCYVCQQLLWGFVVSMAYTLWVASWMTWRMVTLFPKEIACTLSLISLYRFLVKLGQWIFGNLPIFLASMLYKTLKALILMRKSKDYIREKAVKGFMSFTIQQTPPRNSVLELRYEDNSHAAYGACIRLYNGENGMATVNHAYEDLKDGGFVYSLRTKAKIPISQFTEIFNSDKSDITILRGPPNWEGLLGCKSCQIQSVASLARSKATLYTFNGDWQAHNAEIVGSEHTFATTLCNTEPGYSGTPFFNGKTILGLHCGGASNENYNLMSTIPPLAGITMPAYVFETTAPTGRLFTDDDIHLLTKYAQTKLASKKGMRWADDEDDDFFDAPPMYVIEDLPLLENPKQVEPIAPSKKTKITDFFSVQTGPIPEPESLPQAPVVRPVKKKTLTDFFPKSSGPLVFPAPEFKRDPRKGKEPVIEKETVPPIVKSIPANGSGNEERGADRATTGPCTQKKELVDGEQIRQGIEKALLDRIDVRRIEEKIAEKVASGMYKRPYKRRGNKKPRSSESTSRPSTPGKYTPPPMRPQQDSEKSGSSPAPTTPNKNKTQNGGVSSSGNTRNWRLKLKDMGGPSSAPKPN
ncbi:putative P1 [Allium polerovirus A]|uniref:P1 n=1 Tax=Allium polerovirus A TaxID=2593979 RepID=A0AAE9NXX4_9VIRU|nr:putative P1 [Allium polerovirus A]